MSTLFKSLMRPKIKRKLHIQQEIKAQLEDLIPQFQALHCNMIQDNNPSFTFTCNVPTGRGEMLDKSELLYLVTCWHAWKLTERDFHLLNRGFSKEGVWREFEGWFQVIRSHFRKEGLRFMEGGCEVVWRPGEASGSFSWK